MPAAKLRPLIWLLCVFPLGCSACEDCDGDDDDTGGAGGAGAGGAALGGGGTSSTGGQGGAPSTGGQGGASECVAGQTQSCYEGPDGTQDVGVCAAGERTCAADGSYGACEGQVLPGVEDCDGPADEDCDGDSTPCPVVATCSETFGDADFQLVDAVAIDASGAVYFTGRTRGTVDLGAGTVTTANQAVLVVKLDADCGHVWSRVFEGSGPLAGGQSIAVAPDGTVFVGGEFQGSIDFGGGTLTAVGAFEVDMFMLALDDTGAHLWSKRFGDNVGDQYVWGLATTAAGEVVLTGNLPGTADFGGGSVSGLGYVAKLGADGAHQWSRGWAGGRGAGVAVDSTGNVVVAGSISSPTDFGGGVLTPPGAGYGLYVAKYSPTGAHLWSQVLGESVSFGAELRVAITPEDDIVLAGGFAETIDFGGGALTSAGLADVFVAKLDPDGAHVWSRRFGDVSEEYAVGVAVDGAGDLHVAGNMSGTLDLGGGALVAAGMRDLFVAELAPNGDHLSSARFGDSADQRTTDVRANAAGAAAIGGWFMGSLDFGAGLHTSAGSYDGFVAKLPP